MSDFVACLSQASHRFADGTVVRIGGFDFRVKKGQKVVILGPNGSGKTTLLLLLSGLLKIDSGTVKLFGKRPDKNFNKIKRKMGVIFQNVEAQLIAPTVAEDISFSPRNYGFKEEVIEEKVRKVLTLIGIEHLENKIIHYLSGGEKKKVALAGAMVLEPPLLLLDEPFEGLDPRARLELISILELFNDLHETTVVLSTHDVEASSYFADIVYVMNEGNITLKGRPVDVFKNIGDFKKANLKAPQILELTHKLRERGLDILPTIEPEKALRQLLKLKKKHEGA